MTETDTKFSETETKTFFRDQIIETETDTFFLRLNFLKPKCQSLMMWTILRNLGHLIVVKASQSTVVEAQTVILVWYFVFIKSRILWAFHMLKENLKFSKNTDPVQLAY